MLLFLVLIYECNNYDDNYEAAITQLAQVIISRHEKKEIERADFCQKSMKYHPGVARQRRSTS